MSTTIGQLLGVDRLPFHLTRNRVTDAMDLTGKVAAVTGGGGPNLGQAICHRLAGLGATVAVIDQVEENAVRTAEAVRTRWGATAMPFHTDITDADDVARAVPDIASRFGGIDIWVNNVGLSKMPGHTAHSFLDLSPGDIDWFVDVNLKGALYCTRAVLDVMLPRGTGRIINIASETGKSWGVKRTAYSTCKAGVIGFTRSLSHELAGSGVSVVAVCPGVMLNEDRVRSWPEEQRNSPADAPENDVLHHAMQHVSAGRASIPEEVANLVAFLATEAGSYIQGTAVSAGGGLSD